jgi:hypothetical protein
MTTNEAHNRGYAHGRNRASWLFDGNTTDETYRTFLRLYNDGDLPDDFLPPDPLSGEWAGESISEMLGDLVDPRTHDDADADYWNSDIMEAYEDGFRQGWWDELVATANYYTQDLDRV